jgi:hypothetical protein
MGNRINPSDPGGNMSNRKPIRNSLSTLKKYHKWFALVISFFLLLFAISGIILNHRDLFSRIDIPRKWLPADYRYENWNLGAVKSALRVSDDTVFIYGNIGIWLTDIHYENFIDFSSGLPAGIDNKKIFTMLESRNGHIYAGAQSGLYKLDRKSATWIRQQLPAEENRIVGIVQKGDSILAMTRSNILFSNDLHSPEFVNANLPPPLIKKNDVTLFRTLWLIHSGKIYGIAGKIVVDLMALALIFLIISGLIHYFTPGLLKRVSRSETRKKVKSTNKFFTRWHNTLGYLTVFFLVIIALTGIFLRPPFLIPIAGIRVPVIKYSWLDNPNPWFDKLRDIIWDEEMGKFLFSTSEGIYFSGPELTGKLQPFHIEPPVSVMGVNVFEKSGSGEYLVGSFAGIYRWTPGYFPHRTMIKDHLTGHPVVERRASPFGNFPVSGRLEYHGQEVLFNYMSGAVIIPGSHQPVAMNPAFHDDHQSLHPEFVAMPGVIVENSPISLWNLALEVHTGRIFFPLVGNFYILFVPLTGISTLVVLISGLIIWWRKRRRKKIAFPGENIRN